MKIRNKQCAKCPWKVSTDPNEIPNGYSTQQHRGLACTIAMPGDVRGSRSMMACHESAPEREYPCVGWLVHQLGPGNNIALRLQGMDGRFRRLEVDGPQHERFEDTLPGDDDEIDWGDDDD
jgi:hypothetical protein